MMNSIRGFRAAGVFSAERGANVLDSGAYFYDVYRCADDRFVAVGAIEKRFFDEFLVTLGVDPAHMPAQADRDRWDEGRERLRRIFLTRTRDEWTAIFEGSDACVSPVLSVEESSVNRHMRSRGAYVEVAGHVQAGPAPRFSRTVPGTPRPPQPAGGVEVLKSWLSEAEIEGLAASNLLK
jgi:crotonobetainyl-CoA:carnitine CoA-transferase CaiB-like acyl-CoA transferase